jgi:hypothetical protein
VIAMIDLAELRTRPWVQTDWQGQVGISTLAADTVVGALDIAQRTWPELTEETIEPFKAAERRVLLTWVMPNDLARLFKNFEAVLRAGNATEFGMLLCRSPHRFDARVVSILQQARLR